MPSSKTTTRVSAPKPQNRVVKFFSDVITEMKKVTWLSRREIVYLTGLVLIISISVGIVLGVIDWGFSKFVEIFVVGQ